MQSSPRSPITNGQRTGRSGSSQFSDTSSRQLLGAAPGASAMLDAKNSRKRAEADVKLLQNRLKHLQMEEERAFKKVYETKSRAKEILKLKKRNTDHMMNKQSYNHSMSALLNETQQNITSTRLQQKDRLNMTKQTLQEDRTWQGNQGKAQKEQLNAEARRQREGEYRANRARADMERRRRQEAKDRAERERLERERKLQEEYARKIKAEADRRTEAERLIEELEQQEARMINRLKKAQEDQRSAYEDLRTSLDM